MQPDDNDILYDSYGVDFSPVFRSIYDTFTNGGTTGASDFWLSLLSFIDTVWTWWSVIAFLLALLFIIGTIYAYLRINEYTLLMTDKLAREHQAWKELHGGSTANTRWSEVERHVQSDRPNDWKLAIIEADIMLGEALETYGFAGSSIGEQLKSIPPTQMQTLQDAWDAHLIRNKIAHEGADFVLTQGAAREAIIKYERVFRELGEIT